LRVVEPPLLHTELRTLVVGSATGLLADEADPARSQLAGDPLESLGGAYEIGTP
jgi:hypothetical protein